MLWVDRTVFRYSGQPSLPWDVRTNMLGGDARAIHGVGVQRPLHVRRRPTSDLRSWIWLVDGIVAQLKDSPFEFREEMARIIFDRIGYVEAISAQPEHGLLDEILAIVATRLKESSATLCLASSGEEPGRQPH